ncbi:putative uncharacterized protein DDB_G0282133 isoform X2 [Stegodyphus dumicola]|uniref:putative uncharacterized protein DDB_G0282133 isoform X2 n=1 Tax=Stegodyphus dumicola TaxID=202533 RepID=UPI0015B03D3A|nr:putative uncharacterized protein DDB_G0282133 isoform X2 [Stegodyphus dumicola]
MIKVILLLCCIQSSYFAYPFEKIENETGESLSENEHSSLDFIEKADASRRDDKAFLLLSTFPSKREINQNSSVLSFRRSLTMRHESESNNSFNQNEINGNMTEKPFEHPMQGKLEIGLYVKGNLNEINTISPNKTNTQNTLIFQNSHFGRFAKREAVAPAVLHGEEPGISSQRRHYSEEENSGSSKNKISNRKPIVRKMSVNKPAIKHESTYDVKGYNRNNKYFHTPRNHSPETLNNRKNNKKQYLPEPFHPYRNVITNKVDRKIKEEKFRKFQRKPLGVSNQGRVLPPNDDEGNIAEMKYYERDSEFKSDKLKSEIKLNSLDSRKTANLLPHAKLQEYFLPLENSNNDLSPHEKPHADKSPHENSLEDLSSRGDLQSQVKLQEELPSHKKLNNNLKLHKNPQEDLKSHEEPHDNDLLTQGKPHEEHQDDLLPKLNPHDNLSSGGKFRVDFPSNGKFHEDISLYKKSHEPLSAYDNPYKDVSSHKNLSPNEKSHEYLPAHEKTQNAMKPEPKVRFQTVHSHTSSMGGSYTEDEQQSDSYDESVDYPARKPEFNEDESFSQFSFYQDNRRSRQSANNANVKSENVTQNNYSIDVFDSDYDDKNSNKSLDFVTDVTEFEIKEMSSSVISEDNRKNEKFKVQISNSYEPLSNNVSLNKLQNKDVSIYRNDNLGKNNSNAMPLSDVSHDDMLYDKIAKLPSASKVVSTHRYSDTLFTQAHSLRRNSMAIFDTKDKNYIRYPKHASSIKDRSYNDDEFFNQNRREMFSDSKPKDFSPLSSYQQDDYKLKFEDSMDDVNEPSYQNNEMTDFNDASYQNDQITDINEPSYQTDQMADINESSYQYDEMTDANEPSYQNQITDINEPSNQNDQMFDASEPSYQFDQTTDVDEPSYRNDQMNDVNEPSYQNEQNSVKQIHEDYYVKNSNDEDPGFVNRPLGIRKASYDESSEFPRKSDQPSFGNDEEDIITYNNQNKGIKRNFPKYQINARIDREFETYSLPRQKMKLKRHLQDGILNKDGKISKMVEDMGEKESVVNNQDLLTNKTMDDISTKNPLPSQKSDKIQKRANSIPEMDKKISRIIEDNKSKKTIVQGENLLKETDIVENEKQRLLNQIRFKGEHLPENDFNNRLISNGVQIETGKSPMNAINFFQYESDVKTAGNFANDSQASLSFQTNAYFPFEQKGNRLNTNNNYINQNIDNNFENPTAMENFATLGENEYKNFENISQAYGKVMDKYKALLNAKGSPFIKISGENKYLTTISPWIFSNIHYKESLLNNNRNFYKPVEEIPDSEAKYKDLPNPVDKSAENLNGRYVFYENIASPPLQSLNLNKEQQSYPESIVTPILESSVLMSDEEGLQKYIATQLEKSNTKNGEGLIPEYPSPPYGHQENEGNLLTESALGGRLQDLYSKSGHENVIEPAFQEPHFNNDQKIVSVPALQKVKPELPGTTPGQNVHLQNGWVMIPGSGVTLGLPKSNLMKGGNMVPDSIGATRFHTLVNDHQEITPENIATQNVQAPLPNSRITTQYPRFNKSNSKPSDSHYFQISEYATRHFVQEPKPMENFAKQETIVRKTSTLFRNKGTLKNETSRVVGERKTEISDDQQTFHEMIMKQKDEKKYLDGDNDEHFANSNENLKSGFRYGLPRKFPENMSKFKANMLAKFPVKVSERGKGLSVPSKPSLSGYEKSLPRDKANMTPLSTKTEDNVEHLDSYSISPKSFQTRLTLAHQIPYSKFKDRKSTAYNLEGGSNSGTNNGKNFKMYSKFQPPYVRLKSSLKGKDSIDQNYYNNHNFRKQIPNKPAISKTLKGQFNPKLQASKLKPDLSNNKRGFDTSLANRNSADSLYRGRKFQNTFRKRPMIEYPTLYEAPFKGNDVQNGDDYYYFPEEYYFDNYDADSDFGPSSSVGLTNDYDAFLNQDYEIGNDLENNGINVDNGKYSEKEIHNAINEELRHANENLYDDIQRNLRSHQSNNSISRRNDSYNFMKYQDTNGNSNHTLAADTELINSTDRREQVQVKEENANIMENQFLEANLTNKGEDGVHSALKERSTVHSHEYFSDRNKYLDTTKSFETEMSNFTMTSLPPEEGYALRKDVRPDEGYPIYTKHVETTTIGSKRYTDFLQIREVRRSPRHHRHYRLRPPLHGDTL